jgi:hypothetical protein
LAARPPAFIVGRPPLLAEPVYPASETWLLQRLDSLVRARYAPRAVPHAGSYIVYERVR